MKDEDQEDSSDSDSGALEEAFSKLVEKAHAKIEKKMAVARKALAEAEVIADEMGIPFSADLSPLSQTYIPGSMDEMLSEKFPGLDRDVALELADCWGEYDGWQHSQVC